MVLILHRFIRAERDGIWELHIDSLTEMIHYFFAYDRVNYARWASVFLADMKALPTTAESVYDEFAAGNHPVKRSEGSFNQVWTDLALEQSVNRDAKTGGGIVGCTLKEAAVHRCFLTGHIKAEISSATKLMCGLQSSENRDIDKISHKESGLKPMQRDKNDVRKIVTALL